PKCPAEKGASSQWHTSRADWPKRERRPMGYRLAPSVETGARLPGVRWDQEGVQWTPSPPNARPWRAGRERAGQRAYRGVMRGSAKVRWTFAPKNAAPVARPGARRGRRGSASTCRGTKSGGRGRRGSGGGELAPNLLLLKS